jgi:hypothetical protein
VQTRFFFVDGYEAVVLVHDLGLERWRNSRFDLVSTLIDVQRTATHPKRDGLVAEPSADRRRLKNRRKQHHVFALWKHYFVKRWRVLSLQMSFGLVLGQILQQCGLKGEQNFSQVALQVVGGVEVDKIWPKSGQKPFFLVVGDAAQIEESNRSLGVAVKELDFEALAHGGKQPWEDQSLVPDRRRGVFSNAALDLFRGGKNQTNAFYSRLLQRKRFGCETLEGPRVWYHPLGSNSS